MLRLTFLLFYKRVCLGQVRAFHYCPISITILIHQLVSCQEFALNEMSYVLVRLLQVFDGFTIAQAEGAPTQALPPKEWKISGKGRERVEEIHPQAAGTLYSKVR